MVGVHFWRAFRILKSGAMQWRKMLGRAVLGDGAAAGRASDGRVGGACGLRLVGAWLVVTVVALAAVAAVAVVLEATVHTSNIMCE